jgi:hypothetical protein
VENEHKIYAITISKNYAKILDVAISENADYFEKWFIVTQEDDTDTIEVIKNHNKPNIELIFYPLVPSKKQSNHAKSLLKGKHREIIVPPWILPVDKDPSEYQQKELRKLKRKGLVFDKGGALCQIQTQVLPKENLSENDLVLLLDSDIILPRNFNNYISKERFKKNYLYGANRHDFLFYDDFLNKKNCIKYSAFEGAGYFQLYVNDNSKICKRTLDCGYVDSEFKDQFDDLITLEKIKTSHLGAGDMNWEGKEIESFLFNEELEDFCAVHCIEYNEQNFEITKNNVKKFIEAARLYKQQHKRGFPNYFIFGFPNSDALLLINELEEQADVQVAKKRYNEYLNFFEDDKNFDGWFENFREYMSYFPRLLGGNTNWVDFSENLVEHFDLSLERLFLSLKERKFENFNDVKFIFVLKNPINRAYELYNKYTNDFPSSSTWKWCYPGFSFEHNIESEIDSFKSIEKSSDCGTFLRDGCYSYFLHKIIKKFDLKEDDFHVVAIEELQGKNSSQHIKDLCSFLKIKKLNIPIKNNNTSKLSFESKAKLKNFYDPFNKILYKIIKREIKEWEDD